MGDAATMKPRLIPDTSLLGRDDSGGPDFSPYTAEWDSGGYVTGGAKAHLSVSGGKDVAGKRGIEQDSTISARNADKGTGSK